MRGLRARWRAATNGVSVKNDGLTRAFGVAGALGVLTFWTVLALLHALRADLNVLDTYVSDYANGSWGTLFTLAVFAHGAGNMAIAAALYRKLGRRGLAGLGVLAFGVAAAGFFVAGIFPTDPEGVPRSIPGVVHRGAATGSFAIELTALLVLALAFRVLPAWRDHLRVTVSAAVAAALALAWLVLGISIDWVPGLAERAALGTFTVWEFSTALHLARPMALRTAVDPHYEANKPDPGPRSADT